MDGNLRPFDFGDKGDGGIRSTGHTSIMNAGKAETAAHYLSVSDKELSSELEKILGPNSRPRVH
jgi:hypothetical protein